MCDTLRDPTGIRGTPPPEERCHQPQRQRAEAAPNRIGKRSGCEAVHDLDPERHAPTARASVSRSEALCARLKPHQDTPAEL